MGKKSSKEEKANEQVQLPSLEEVNPHELYPSSNDQEKSSIKRIGGYLHSVTHVRDPRDHKGKIFNLIVKPLMIELRPRDIMQIIVGAALFAIPVSFSEEVWSLGETLPFTNILILTFLSILLIASFVYFNFYRFNFKNHVFEYVKRVLATYFLSLLVVAGILTLIDKCPWGENNLLAIKRIIIIAFPASMSATLSDTLK